ncbi:TetR/AcrR family transcriptional regulator [Virgibacillus sp. C22-A2]|uniref:TetR/AcrR family transcriptional regulator n=1 Tax=Virgibacillus tibetensis TaxID=3042313 RepID=A0ABU6KCY4_9BACI|nr:TetR/AcrR family transcriptional regulator [Virgibacillus sp. C22-A2]
MQLKNSQVDRRIRRTKRNLKKAAINLMKIKEYNSITVKDIVASADYNRATFYRHYQDKEDLKDQLVDELLDKLINAFRYPYKNSKFVNAYSLTPSNVRIFDYIKDNADFYMLWKDSEGIPGFQGKFIQTLTELFNQDIVHLSNQQGDIDNELFITYRTYGVWGLIINWIKSDFKTPSQDMAKQLINIINYHPLKIYETKHF